MHGICAELDRVRSPMPNHVVVELKIPVVAKRVTFRNNRDFEFYDNVIWHRGTHTIKFGAYAMHYDLRPVNPNGARGIFSFTPRWTSSAAGLADGNTFADF